MNYFCLIWEILQALSIHIYSWKRCLFLIVVACTGVLYWFHDRTWSLLSACFLLLTTNSPFEQYWSKNHGFSHGRRFVPFIFWKAGIMVFSGTGGWRPIHKVCEQWEQCQHYITDWLHVSLTTVFGLFKLNTGRLKSKIAALCCLIPVPLKVGPCFIICFVLSYSRTIESWSLFYNTLCVVLFPYHWKLDLVL